jgi:HK97 gp10 family phage protein
MPVTVVGFDKLQAFIENLPNIIKKSADDIMGVGAEMMLSEAQRLVPVRTGTLQRSIRVVHRGLADWQVGSIIYYAGYVEYGTRFQMAQPYLSPAYYLVEPRVRSAVFSVIDEATVEWSL